MHDEARLFLSEENTLKKWDELCEHDFRFSASGRECRRYVFIAFDGAGEDVPADF
jgi:hypothetical protein